MMYHIIYHVTLLYTILYCIILNYIKSLNHVFSHGSTIQQNIKEDFSPKSFLDLPTGAYFGDVRGAEFIEIHHPLGFKQHPLEDAD